MLCSSENNVKISAAYKIGIYFSITLHNVADSGFCSLLHSGVQAVGTLRNRMFSIYSKVTSHASNGAIRKNQLSRFIVDSYLLALS